MKRRGFLGLMGGAAVAGPSMVKQAAASTMADLSLPIGVATGLSSLAGETPDVSYAGPSKDRYLRRLSDFTKFMGSTERLARRKREWHVSSLDPDLAGYRSLSLSAKMNIQREREFNRWLSREKSWLERMIAGDEGEYY